MKYLKIGMLSFAGLMSILSSNAFAVSVTSATLDADDKNILVSVTYGGGCGSHKFSLKIGKCTRSFPVRCNAVLKDETDDHCRALFYKTVVLSLKENGLDTDYFSGGTLTIRGDGDARAAGVVRLPEHKPQ